MPETDCLLTTQRSGCFRRLKIKERFKTFFPWFFTDLPWQTMEYISNPDTIPAESDQSIKDQKKKRKEKERARRDNRATSYCSLAYITTTAAITLILVMIFQLSLIMIGLVAQLMTCFRRDWISTNLTTVLIHKTSKEKLRCDDKVEVITGLLIPSIW